MTTNDKNFRLEMYKKALSYIEMKVLANKSYRHGFCYALWMTLSKELYNLRTPNAFYPYDSPEINYPELLPYKPIINERKEYWFNDTSGNTHIRILKEIIAKMEASHEQE